MSGSLRDMATALQLSDWEESMVTSGLNLVSGIGALLVGGSFIDVIGRKPTLLISSVLLLFGSVVVCSAASVFTLIIGRALQGLGAGCSWCAATVYITEIAPREWRGALVAIADVAINVGILFGIVIDRAVNVGLAANGPDTRWRVAMGLSALLPIAYLCCYPLLPESPRWLLLIGRDPKPALLAVTASEERAAEELVAMRAAPKVQDVTWRNALCAETPRLRSLVGLAMVVGLCQQVTGTEAILYYTPRILNECPAATPTATPIAGSNNNPAPAARLGCTSADAMFGISLGVGFSKLLGELVAAAVLVENTGRRVTMTSATLLLTFATFAIALRFGFGWPTSMGAVALCIAMLGFSLGPGPLTFVVINEMLPLSLRGKVVSLAILCNRLASGTVALTFLSLQHAMGEAGAFALYGSLGVCVTAFYYIAVPDVRGKQLEANEGADEETESLRGDDASAGAGRSVLSRSGKDA